MLNARNKLGYFSSAKKLSYVYNAQPKLELTRKLHFQGTISNKKISVYLLKILHQILDRKYLILSLINNQILREKYSIILKRRSKYAEIKNKTEVNIINKV